MDIDMQAYCNEICLLLTKNTVFVLHYSVSRDSLTTTRHAIISGCCML